MKRIGIFLKDSIKKFNKKSIGYKIFLIVIILVFIFLIISNIFLYKNQISTIPSDADFKVGLEKTFKNISQINCDFYAKVNYGKDYYKYTCNIDYQIDNETEVITNYETCVDCEITDGKWICNVGSKKCFK